MKRLIVITVITILVAGCATTGYAFAMKSTQLETANLEIANLTGDTITLGNEISDLSDELSSLSIEMVSLEEENDDLNTILQITEASLNVTEGRITSLETSLTTVQNNYQNVSNELSELKSFYDGIFKGEAPPYFKPNNQLMNLIDNHSAQDPTWQQLVNFLNADQTDRREYIMGEYVCSGFTEDVHNHAEAAGLRCAVVGVTFENSDVGHVLNAFNTVDRRLVFIDCTGVQGYSNHSYDRVAYLRIGEQYGCLVPVTSIQSFEYEHYQTTYSQLMYRIEQYRVDVANHNLEVDSHYVALQNYNAEVDAYGEAVDAYYKNPTYPEYLRLTAWYNALQTQLNSLNAWSSSLNVQAALLNQELYELGLQYDSFGGVLGIVEEVKMYW